MPLHFHPPLRFAQGPAELVKFWVPMFPSSGGPAHLPVLATPDGHI